MTSTPQFGRKRQEDSRPTCRRHPKAATVSQCTRCGRYTCPDCTIRPDVATVCPECLSRRTGFRASTTAPAGAATTARTRPKLLRGTTVSGSIIAVTSLLWVASLFTSWPVDFFAFSPVAGYYEPWRFLTVALVHASFAHIAMNMFSLYLFGPPVERVLGWWRFLALYLAAVLGGSVAVLAYSAWDTTALTGWTVGASGGIFGLFAALFVIQRFLSLDTRAIAILLLINVAYSFYAGNVSWQGHLGGAIAGGLVTWALVHLMTPRPNLTARKQEALNVAAVVGMIGVEVAAIVGLYALILN